DRNLTAYDIRVYLYLKLRQGENSNTWPSPETIAKDIGISEKTVRKSIANLKKQGYLKVIKPNKKGRGYYNKYVIIEPKKVVNPTTLSEKGGKSFHQKVVGNTEYIDTVEIESRRRKQTHIGKTFVPPTPDEVREYAVSIKYPGIDAERFCEYYAAEDWTLKDGSKMRSWRRSVVNWKSREREKQQGQKTPIPEPAMPTEEQIAIATKD
ncbi:MAG: helix-turn-helix domain-containing protein, partial [Planctomycetota bacterium]